MDIFNNLFTMLFGGSEEEKQKCSQKLSPAERLDRQQKILKQLNINLSIPGLNDSEIMFLNTIESGMPLADPIFSDLVERIEIIKKHNQTQ